MLFCLFVTDEKGDTISSPLLKRKSERAKSQEPNQAGRVDLNSVDVAIAGGRYDSVSKLDHDLSAALSAPMRDLGKHSTAGAAAAKLKKVYTS